MLITEIKIENRKGQIPGTYFFPGICEIMSAHKKQLVDLRWLPEDAMGQVASLYFDVVTGNKNTN